MAEESKEEYEKLKNIKKEDRTPEQQRRFHQLQMDALNKAHIETACGKRDFSEDGALYKKILALSKDDQHLIWGFLAGRAKIIPNAELETIQEAQRWYLSMDILARQQLANILQGKTPKGVKLTADNIITAAREITSRVTPQKTELKPADPTEKMSDQELVDTASKILKAINQ